MDWLVLGAFALDLAIGDPRAIPHPVVAIGMLISWLEELLIFHIPNRRIAGVCLTLGTLGITGAVVALVLGILNFINPLIGWVVGLWIAATTLALRSLHRESRAVVDRLEEGDLEGARKALSMIVGRDTANLNEEQVLKACIETVAENTSDGIISPLFYLFLGGPVLAMVFKAASTLDSMVGYKNEKYLELGWASARLDDLLNYVPARLTGLSMALAAGSLGLDGAGALQVMLRDARKHSSPNAGYPEAALAGALGVQLGGSAIYFGKRVEKPTLGDSGKPVTIKSYRETIQIMYLCSGYCLLFGLFLTWVI